MFTNVPGVARVAFNEYGRFWMYELNEDGKRVGGPYRDMTRDQALGALVSIIIRRCGLF